MLPQSKFFQGRLASLRRGNGRGGVNCGRKPFRLPLRGARWGKGNDRLALEFAESLDGRVLDEENRAGGVEELQVAVRGEA